MVAPTAESLVSTEGRTMQALANVHMINHHLSPRQFLRSAYMWRYQKDIPDLALASDAKALDEQGTIPCYLTDYLIHIYGVQ